MVWALVLFAAAGFGQVQESAKAARTGAKAEAVQYLYPEQLTVADLFKYNTIESLGAFIDATSATEQFAAVQGYEL